MSAQTVEERLASIEATLPHLATKADIERLQTVMIKWLVGIGLAAANSCGDDCLDRRDLGNIGEIVP